MVRRVIFLLHIPCCVLLGHTINVNFLGKVQLSTYRILCDIVYKRVFEFAIIRMNQASHKNDLYYILRQCTIEAPLNMIKHLSHESNEMIQFNLPEYPIKIEQ